MHECDNCGQACTCDIEDTWMPAPPDCSCPCAYEDLLDPDDLGDDQEPTP